MKPSQRQKGHLRGAGKVKANNNGEKKLYIVSKLCLWKDLECNVNMIRFQPPEGEEGFCRIFNDYDKALEFAGEPELVCLCRILERGREK